MRRTTILWLGVLTLTIFPAIAWLVMYFFETADPALIFQTRSSYPVEIGIGLGYGLLSGYLAWKLISHPHMDDVRTYYGNIIASIKMKPQDIVFVSFCAGFGEEVLFRGAIQPAWGVWITSFIFVALHGYINPANMKVTAYGLYLLLCIAGIGYIHDIFGLVACIVAHTVIDIYLFHFLSRKEPEE